MKKNLVLLSFILGAASLSAQYSNKDLRLIEEIYEETDPYIEGLNAEVPESFKNESAVVLDDIEVETFENKGNKRRVYGYYRLIIKINDDAALDRHSTFSYDNFSRALFGNRSSSMYAIKIHKPNGEEVMVDLEAQEQNANDKIAIPNLSIGDIIDYGLQIENTIYSTCFDPEVRPLTDDYPIINGYKRFTVQRGFFVNFKSMNGAPSLVRNEELSDRKTYVYELNFDNQKATSTERWAPRLRTEPSTKIQLCYSSLGSARRSSQILKDPYEVTTEASFEDKKNAISNEKLSNLPNNDARLSYFEKWFRKSYRDENFSADEYMRLAYYHFRYYSLIYDPLYGSYRSQYHTQYLKPIYFIRLMQTIADDRGIPNDVVYSSSKNISSFEDVIMSAEFIRLFTYKSDDGTWKYIETPFAYQTRDYIDYRLEGQEGILHNKLERVTIPATTPEYNFSHKNFYFTPDFEAKMVESQVRTRLMGNFKYQDSRQILEGTDYHEEAAESVVVGDTEVFETRADERKKERTLERVEGDEDTKLLDMKEIAENNFNIEKYNSFKLISSGVISENDSLIYDESYSIKDAIEKVGPSYILKLGEISVGQVSFSDEEATNRLNDVYIDYPKTYSYTYIIEIPEGYEVKGLENLNASQSNEAGSVDMSAIIQDSKIIVNLEKVYAVNYLPKEKWPLMIEFLEPASRINDAQLVFKPAAQ